MRITSGWWVAPALLLCTTAPAGAQAPGGDAVPPPEVTTQRLLHSADEPGNWMIYGGNYWNQRYSKLKQITAANVGRMIPRKILQTGISLFRFSLMIAGAVLVALLALLIEWLGRVLELFTRPKGI